MVDYHFNFTFVWRHFDRLAWGWLLSLEIAFFALVVGAVVGLLLEVLMTSQGRLVSGLVQGYVELFRNVPLLLLVYVAFYGMPTLGIRILDATHSFAITLALYASAQFVEVFRAGIENVPRGMTEAGKALGLGRAQTFTYITLPLAVRNILPAIGNLVVSFFKETSIASAIAVPELTYDAQWINLNSFRVVEVYAIVTPMYLATSYALSAIVLGVEGSLRRTT